MKTNAADVVGLLFALFALGVVVGLCLAAALVH